MKSDHKKNIRVLIVEDSVAIVKKIQGMLYEAGEGFETESVDCLESVLNILKNNECDIILLDLNLRDSKGLDTLIKIKQRNSSIPVIVITGEYNESLGIKAVSIGAQDFIIKDNLDGNSLIKAVKYAIERKRVEKKLLESEARWQALVQNSPDLIINLSYNGNILFINRTLPWFDGFTIKHMIGQEIYKFLSHENQAKIQKAIEAVFQGGIIRNIECKIIHDDVMSRHSVRFSPVVQDNEIIAVNMTATDISERVNIGKHLQQSRMLESIGTLASGISHEINTPMQYIADNTLFFSEGVIALFELINKYQDLLRDCCGKNITADILEEADKAGKEADLDYLRQEIPSAISQSLEGIDRVKKIINAMKFFSHVDTNVMEKANINQAIESSAMISKNEWKYVADLETDLDPELPDIPCFIGEINQVLMNLIINAAQAIADVIKEESKEKGLIKITSKKTDKFIIISVMDTGSGIPDKIRDRIFDPFFTTKDVGKGTGQGLALAYDIIVRRHNGDIAFESQLGKGTVFKIRLPVHTDQTGLDIESY